MKSTLLIFVAFCAFIQIGAAQEKSSSSSNSTNSDGGTTPHLSDQDQVALRNAINTVLKDYNEGHYDDALTQLDIADKITPKNPELLNFRGNILMKQLKWDQAQALFIGALAIDPKYFPARFNTGEILYLQKKFGDARTIFLSMLTEYPKNELVIYKIYLTYLLENNIDQAKTYLDKFDALGNTPAYYFAQAAWCYNKKQDKDGNSYVQSAVTIFPPAVNTIFAKPLIDAGWLKPSS